MPLEISVEGLVKFPATISPQDLSILQKEWALLGNQTDYRVFGYRKKVLGQAFYSVGKQFPTMTIGERVEAAYVPVGFKYKKIPEKSLPSATSFYKDTPDSRKVFVRLKGPLPEVIGKWGLRTFVEAAKEQGLEVEKHDGDLFIQRPLNETGKGCRCYAEYHLQPDDSYLKMWEASEGRPDMSRGRLLDADEI
jgi:hypothetical protein